MKTIIVQMSDEQWTMEAMHLASALARNVDGKLVLLRLTLANNPGLLGWGMAPPSEAEHRQVEEYIAVAEDYGVECWVQPMQYFVIVDALVQAAENLRVSFLFAHIPQSRFSLWTRFRLWNLNRRLGNCRLCALDEEQRLNIEASTPVTEIWERQ